MALTSRLLAGMACARNVLDGSKDLKVTRSRPPSKSANNLCVHPSPNHRLTPLSNQGIIAFVSAVSTMSEWENGDA